jgi:hypothetical protein
MVDDVTYSSIVSTMRIAVLAVLLALVGSSNAGWAQNIPYKQSQSVWHRMDACRQQAQKQYPNWTAKDAKARNRATKRCLASQILPPVTPLGPSMWPPASDDGGSATAN